MTSTSDFEQQLTKRGYRLTRPREAILGLLRATESHPDANWVYDRVRQEIPNISLGTVYRTLGILVKAGLIQQFYCGESAQSRYDGNPREHHHVVCRRCGAVHDAYLCCLDDVEAAIEAETGFVIGEHSCSFLGLCPDCQDVQD